MVRLEATKPRDASVETWIPAQMRIYVKNSSRVDHIKNW
jgi:hypothetical protein